MRLTWPYRDRQGGDRAGMIRAALLVMTAVAGPIAPRAGHASDEMPARVTNSLGYTEMLMGRDGGMPPSGAPPAASEPVVPVAYEEMAPPMPPLPPSPVAPAAPPTAPPVASDPPFITLPPLPTARPHVAPMPAPVEPAPVVAPMPAPIEPVEVAPMPASFPEGPAGIGGPADLIGVGDAFAPEAAYIAPTMPPVDPHVEPTACAACGGSGHLIRPMPATGALVDGTCASCGGSGQCVPGRGPCYTPWMGHSFLGRFCGNLYECLCCPDPCYQPTWVPEANAAFFTEFARPRTVTRFRWDRRWNMPYPDIAEYYWAGQKIDAAKVPQRFAAGQFVNIKGGGSRGPGFPPAAFKGLLSPRVPFFGEPSLNTSDLYLYQEVASARASFFTRMPYRAYDPLLGAYEAGFGDLSLGTKAMWLDCELMQLTFMFTTYIPTASAGKGLGTGHVSLEPSLLMSLRLAPETYFQGQIAEWIPIGGDDNYQGSILHYHFSFNRTLLRLAPDSPLIGTLEFSGWTFQDGAFTDPIFGPNQFASDTTFFGMGPGLRLSICDAIDGGFAWMFPITSDRWADATLRAELRILY